MQNPIDKLKAEVRKELGIQTNADKIRSMSDEELAEFFDSGLVSIEFHCEECNNHLNCDVCYLIWLQSEAE